MERRADLLVARRDDFSATSRLLDVAVDSASTRLALSQGYIDVVSQQIEAKRRSADCIAGLTITAPPPATPTTRIPRRFVTGS